jgi:hypothetical protein
MTSPFVDQQIGQADDALQVPVALDYQYVGYACLSHHLADAIHRALRRYEPYRSCHHRVHFGLRPWSLLPDHSQGDVSIREHAQRNTTAVCADLSHKRVRNFDSPNIVEFFAGEPRLVMLS